jgi:hypothetical protein
MEYIIDGSPGAAYDSNRNSALDLLGANESVGDDIDAKLRNESV